MLNTKVPHFFSIKDLDYTVTGDYEYVQEATKTILPKLFFATYTIVSTDKGKFINKYQNISFLLQLWNTEYKNRLFTKIYLIFFLNSTTVITKIKEMPRTFLSNIPRSSSINYQIFNTYQIRVDHEFIILKLALYIKKKKTLVTRVSVL